MRKATNLIELFKVLVPSNYLGPDRDPEFYVKVYEDKLDTLRFSIQYDPNPQKTFYVTGQSGTGKTTALNFLPNDELDAEFAVVSLYTRDLLDLNDIDVIDLLLMTCYRLMARETEIKSTRELERLFKDRLDKIRDKQQGIIDETVEQEKKRAASAGGGAKVEVGTDVNPFVKFISLFKASGNFFADFRMDNQYREITRRAFKLNKRELLELTNKILEKFRENVVDGKQLLLVFNELDHVKDLTQIKELFIENRYYLENIDCKKVVSIPVILNTEGEFTLQGEILEFGLKTRRNGLPEAAMRSQPEVDANQQILAQVARQRIAEGTDLITDEGIGRAIEASGGILRQFISILHYATRRAAMAKGERVSINDVNEAISQLRSQMEPALIFGGRIAVLEHVRLQKKPNSPDDKEFLNALLSNQVIIFYNEPAWYEVNPLIEKTVEIYARQRPDRPALT